MPGFLPHHPTCFSSPKDIQAYYRDNPHIIEYADDFIDTAGNPFSNWSGSPGSSWETAPHIDDTHWNMVHEDNSEVFTEHGMASIWGSEIPPLEDVDFSANFDETGWLHGAFNWDDPRPFTFFWPPTLQLDTANRQALLNWHAAMDWASRDTFIND
ncbi:hypothetical protein EV363DRAFT_1159145 [Boletus edulis]|nr:hypothetical protein EV363DRAFT_1159145 [Boletus edulis]